MFELALQINLSDSFVYFGKGRVLHNFSGNALSEKGKFDEAIRMYDIAI